MIWIFIGAEADVLRHLILLWLVTKGGAGDASTWHCQHMLSCPPEEEADDGKIVVAAAAAILSGDGPEPTDAWFERISPAITGQPRGPLSRMLRKRKEQEAGGRSQELGARRRGMREDLD